MYKGVLLWFELRKRGIILVQVGISIYKFNSMSTISLEPSVAKSFSPLSRNHDPGVSYKCGRCEFQPISDWLPLQPWEWEDLSATRGWSWVSPNSVRIYSNHNSVRRHISKIFGIRCETLTDVLLPFIFFDIMHETSANVISITRIFM